MEKQLERANMEVDAIANEIRSKDSEWKAASWFDKAHIRSYIDYLKVKEKSLLASRDKVVDAFAAAATAVVARG